MVKGSRTTVKRLFKRLQKITHETCRSFRRSDRRAVALAAHYSRIGFNTAMCQNTPPTAFTGAPGTGSAVSSAVASAKAEGAKEDGVHPVLMAPPKSMQAAFDRILRGQDDCAIAVTREGRFAKLGRGWANA